MVGRIVSINISKKKGQKKSPVEEVVVVENYGIEGDAHARSEKRQVSILRVEDINTMRLSGVKIKYGDFAENLTVEGLDRSDIKIGTYIKIGEVLLEVTQIGKTCHNKCNIYRQVGFCVMPEWGIFTKVLKGGRIRKGDIIEIVKSEEVYN